MKKTVEHFILYMEVVQAKTENTIRVYSRDLYQFVEYLINYENITDFSAVDIMTIRSYIVYLNKEKHIGKRSINRKISSIKSFYKYLVDNGQCVENKIGNTPRPKYEKKIPVYLNKDEIDRIRAVIDTDTIEGVRDRAMIETLYSSGVRSIELLSLSESAIDFDEMQLKILGKGNKERITFISPVAKKWIQKYIELKKLKFKNYDKSILFSNVRETRLSTRSLRRIVSNYATKAGIQKEVSPHVFRHSFATELLSGGVDIRYVQDFLGHSSLSTTQIYTHVSKKLIQQIYLKVHPKALEDEEKEENE